MAHDDEPPNTPAGISVHVRTLQDNIPEYQQTLQKGMPAAIDGYVLPRSAYICANCHMAGWKHGTYANTCGVFVPAPTDSNGLLWIPPSVNSPGEVRSPTSAKSIFAGVPHYILAGLTGIGIGSAMKWLINLF